MPKRRHSTLAEAWAEALLFTAHTAYHDDGGCFTDLLRRQVVVVDDWTVISQPTRAMAAYDEFLVAIIIRRTDGAEITKAMWKQEKPGMKEVETLFLQSYSDIRVRSGDTRPIGSLETVAQIRSPLTLEKGLLKMKFEIRMPNGHDCGSCWHPYRLMAWMGKPCEWVDDKGELIENLNEFIEDQL